MKAAVVEHLGRIVVRETETPLPSPHEVQIAISVAGVNPIDWKTRDRGERAFPFVAGQDFAGIVAEAGARAHRYRRGERVFGIARAHGSYAQYTVVPEDDTSQPMAKIPDDVGDADAAALPTAGLTALASLDALRVENGTTLLVVGAAGGVGHIALQIARDRGARIIGIAGSRNESLTRSLGADEFFPYDGDEDAMSSIRRAHPDGIEAVLDLVDDADAIRTLSDVVRPGGRVVSTIGSCDVDWFASRKIAAQNLVMAQTPASSHEGLRTLAKMVEDGRLRVLIAREFPLEEAAEALEESKRGTLHGKLVLTVEQAP